MLTYFFVGQKGSKVKLKSLAGDLVPLQKTSLGSQIETEILCSPEIVTALLLLCFLYKRTWGDPPVHLPPQILSLLLSRAIWEVSETSDQSHTAVVVYFQILLNIYTPLEKKKNPENSKRKKKLFHSRFILNGD